MTSGQLSLVETGGWGYFLKNELAIHLLDGIGRGFHTINVVHIVFMFHNYLVQFIINTLRLQIICGDVLRQNYYFFCYNDSIFEQTQETEHR
jgi:hypothetical protein